jgi:hypothetical protein
VLFEAAAKNPELEHVYCAAGCRGQLQGLRSRDLRHSVIIEPAEMGVPDHVMECITGHLSRKLLEHCSHVRIDAKRKALDH